MSPYSPITRLFRNPLYIAVDDSARAGARRVGARAHRVAGVPGGARGAARRAHGRLRARDGAARAGARVAASHLRGARARRRDARAAARTRSTWRARIRSSRSSRRSWRSPSARARTRGTGRSRCATRTGRRWPRCARSSPSAWTSTAGCSSSWTGSSAASATDATRAGLALGVYQDLAVGSAPSGSDVWANPGLFVQGATVGAPPDMYSDEGQNWGLPAIDPHVLRETGYDYWVRLLRAGFRHAGALRIDHALGLFRMFWVPLGAPAREGTFMKSFTRRAVRHPRARERAPRLARRRRGSGHRAAGGAAGAGEVGRARLEGASCSSATSTAGDSGAADRVSAARARDGEHARPAAARRAGWSSATSSCGARWATSPIRSSSAAMRDARTGDRWALIEMLIEAGLLPDVGARAACGRSR